MPAANHLSTVKTDDPYADSERSFEIVNGKVVEKHRHLIESLIANLLLQR